MIFDLLISVFFIISATIITVLLVLPIFLFRLATNWVDDSKVSGTIASITAGVIMGGYVLIISSLGKSLLNGGGSIISTWEGGQAINIASLIAGAISGMLFQTGIRSKASKDVLLIVGGIAVLFLFGLFFAFLTIAPE
jgi:hypothetical protein